MINAEALITQARLISRNANTSGGAFAITDAEVLQYINDGQDRMQSLMSAQKNIAKLFVTDVVISIVAGQAAYSIPDRLAMNKQIEFVEMSATGQTQDYLRLEKLEMFARDTYPSNYPYGYIKRGGQILLQPTPAITQGSLRVSYERCLDDLALSATTVSGTPAGTDITVVSDANILAGNYICISDVEGNILLRNAQVLSKLANVLTLTAAVSTFLQGSYTLTNLAGNTVTVGRYTTNVSLLPNECERYLIHAGAMSLFHRDSSKSLAGEKEILTNIEDDILANLAAQTGEIQYTPNINRLEWGL